MSRNKKIALFSSLIAVSVFINAYLSLRNNEYIQKSYYIDNIQFAESRLNTEELQKDGVIASNQIVRLSASSQSVNEVSVKVGDTIYAQHELATYNREAVEQEIQKYEIELTAYQSELSELEDILSDLERQSGSNNSSSSTDSTTLGDSNSWNIDFTIELGIEQNTPTAEGIAIIRKYIAEIEREINILDNTLMQMATNASLVSPIDGVVSDIIQDASTITFVIYPIEKSVVAYINTDQWQKVKIGQATQIIIRPEGEDEYIVEGTVLEKQEIPTEDSPWYNELAKDKKIDINDTLYEIHIQPTDFLTDYPYLEKVAIAITTNEVFDSFMVPADWIIEHEIENIGENHIYTVGYDGKTRLIPVDVAFIKLGKIEGPSEEQQQLAQEPTEEEPMNEPSKKTSLIQTVNLSENKNSEIKKEDLYNVTVFTGSIDENTILLDGTARNIYAPTFRPYPLKKFKSEQVGPVTWQDIVYYMIQP